MSLTGKVQHYLNRYWYHRTRRMFPNLEGPKSAAACGQDLLVAHLLGDERDGVFVDIGANDGVTISNTLYFERELGWTGLAVEPIPGKFERLRSNRTCQMVQGCVRASEGKATFTEVVGGSNMLSTLSAHNTGLTARRLRKNAIRHKDTVREIEVDCFNFNSLMRKFGIPRIDFLSVDTEGGELEILESIDFGNCPVQVVSVENNFYTNDIRDLMEKRGFLSVGTFKVDEIYLFGGQRLRERCGI